MFVYINFRCSSVLTKIKHGRGQSTRMIEVMTVQKGELSEGQEPGDGEGGKCSSFKRHYSFSSDRLPQRSSLGDVISVNTSRL